MNVNHFCCKLSAIHGGSLSLSLTWNSLVWTACPVRTWFFRNVVSSKYQHNSVRWIIHPGFIKPELHGYLVIFPHIRRSTSPLHVSRACHIFFFSFSTTSFYLFFNISPKRLFHGLSTCKETVFTSIHANASFPCRPLTLGHQWQSMLLEPTLA